MEDSLPGRTRRYRCVNRFANVGTTLDVDSDSKFVSTVIQPRDKSPVMPGLGTSTIHMTVATSKAGAKGQ